MKMLKSFLKSFERGKSEVSDTSLAKNAVTKEIDCIGTSSFIVTFHVNDEQLMAAGLSATSMRGWLEQLVWEGISRNTWLNKIVYVRQSTTAIATKLPFVYDPNSESALSDILKKGGIVISHQEFNSTSTDRQV